MVAFVGAQLARQWAGTAVVVQPVVPLLLAVYLGVVISDLVTYALGAGLSKGLFRPMRRVLFPEQGDGTEKELKVAKRFGRASGILQRFLIGLRGPICLAAGFTGIPVAKFAAGAALGACITIPLQLGAGYLLRDTANPYLAMLAIVALPNTIGHIAAVVAAPAAAVAAWMDARRQPTDAVTGAPT